MFNFLSLVSCTIIQVVPIQNIFIILQLKQTNKQKTSKTKPQKTLTKPTNKQEKSKTPKHTIIRVYKEPN